MQTRTQNALEDTCYVGRRICQHESDPEFLVEDDGSVRFLLNAFLEDRVGEHVSVDQMWAEGDSGKKRTRILEALGRICTTESSLAVGWAKSRVDGVRRIDVLEGVCSQETPTNKRHSLLLKMPFLLLLSEDDPNSRNRKARIVANALKDYFNGLGRDGFVGRDGVALPANELPAPASPVAQPRKRWWERILEWCGLFIEK
jgi:hypothetical protein